MLGTNSTVLNAASHLSTPAQCCTNSFKLKLPTTTTKQLTKYSDGKNKTVNIHIYKKKCDNDVNEEGSEFEVQFVC